jgi:hypothetical protein
VTDSIEGLTELVADLNRAQSRALPEVTKISAVAANNVKRDLNRNLWASSHFKGAGGSVTYDETTRLGRVEFEVGPDKERRGGALANVAFFGTSRGGGTVDLDGPVRAEEKAFYSFIDKAVAGLL